MPEPEPLESNQFVCSFRWKCWIFRISFEKSLNIIRLYMMLMVGWMKDGWIVLVEWCRTQTHINACDHAFSVQLTILYVICEWIAAQLKCDVSRTSTDWKQKWNDAEIMKKGELKIKSKRFRNQHKFSCDSSSEFIYRFLLYIIMEHTFNSTNQKTAGVYVLVTEYVMVWMFKRSNLYFSSTFFFFFLLHFFFFSFHVESTSLLRSRRRMCTNIYCIRRFETHMFYYYYLTKHE